MIYKYTNSVIYDDLKQNQTLPNIYTKKVDFCEIDRKIRDFDTFLNYSRSLEIRFLLKGRFFFFKFIERISFEFFFRVCVILCFFCFKIFLEFSSGMTLRITSRITLNLHLRGINYKRNLLFLRANGFFKGKFLFLSL